MDSMAIRNVHVNRGPSGFGITLSGQNPCVLSNVHATSEAHQAGLRHGDRLYKVNGIPVDQAPHDEVVGLIARSGPSLTLSILPGTATNGKTAKPLSSSDEDDDFIQNRAHYIVEQMQNKRLLGEPEGTNSSAELVNILFNRNRPSYASGFHQHRSTLGLSDAVGHLRVVVSYLGSVSCSTEEWAQSLLGRAIAQLKDQQRVLVAMQVTGDALVLTNHRGTAVARFTQDRIVFYGMDEADSSYFGIVTRQGGRQMSAHVFVADSRLVPHTSHARRARTFKIACQRDPKSNTCKEFPSTAHPIMMALAKIRACPAPTAPRSLYDSDSGFRDDSLERSINSGQLGKQLLGSSLEEVSAGLRDLIVLEKSPSKTSESQVSLDSLDAIHHYKHSPKVYALRKQHSLDALDSPRLNYGNHRRQHSGLSAQEPLQSQPSVASWTDSLDAVLNHPEGILIFAKFLKKEFAQENIFFWTACEKYRQESSQTQRKSMAKEIFEKHLKDDSLEPVNIDSTTLRNISTHVAAGLAPRDMFAAAQEHIYNLMRMDCYPRFLKSELYQQCLIKAVNGEPLLISPLKSDPPDPPMTSSCLALHKNVAAFSSQEITSSRTNVSTSSTSSVSTSGGSIAKARRSLFPHVKKLTRKKKEDEKKEENQLKNIIKVVTPSGEKKHVPVNGTEALAVVISEVLQKSTASGTSLVDVFVAQSQQPVDLSTPVAQLLKETITIEPRVAFLVALPSGAILGVKCAPAGTLKSVIQNVSIRYGLDATQMACRQDNTTKLLDPQTSCGQLDGVQLVLTAKSQRYGGPVSPWYGQGQDIRTFLSQVQSGAVIFDECGFALFSLGAPPLPPKPVKFQRGNHPLENVCNISFV